MGYQVLWVALQSCFLLKNPKCVGLISFLVSFLCFKRSRNTKYAEIFLVYIYVTGIGKDSFDVWFERNTNV